jgi:hypothetical protein
MAWLVIGLACLSVFYFMLDSNLVNSTIEPESNYENYDAKNTTFETAKTNVSNLSYDIYYQMMVGNTIIPVKISSLGNPVSNINYDNEEKSIILVINSLNEKIDKLIIDIPRIILDSKVNGNDKNFTVLADDQPATFLEIKNPDKGKPILNSTIGNISAVQYSNNTESRKLMVEFESNTKIIEIIGTDTTLANEKNIPIGEVNSLFHVPILIDNNTENLSLQLSGGTLDYIQLTSSSEDNRTLLLSISSYSNKGNLIIDIPRIILDSKVNGNDKNFTVLADDQPAKFLEIKNPDKGKPILNSTIGNISAVQYPNNTESRKLMVEFESNTKIIEIIGTDTTLANNQSIDNSTQNNTIPEKDRNLGNFVFPIISIIVSLVGISLFFYFRKNKAHLMNKFKPK